MKRFLITSACTLGLTLLGTFGSNQNSLNATDSLNINNNSTQVVQNNSDTQQKQVTAVQVSTKSDLSKCKTVKDVVKVIKKNGTVVTTKPAPTKKPEATAQPAPTKKPAAATKPTPTKKPAANTNPTPTKKPAATTKPTPTTKPDQGTNTSDLNAYAKQVLQIVNQERANAGLPALTTNSTLQSAANKRAQEIVKNFSHTRPDGSSCFTVLNEFGVSYRSAGENIAYGQKTPQEVMKGWMNSSGHRANILNSKFGKVGIGVYKVNGVLYWTQVFTN